MTQPYVEPCARGIIEAQPSLSSSEADIPPRQRRAVLAACVLASSMAFIDSSVLTVALPALRTALGADLAAVQWVLNGYVLALASLTLIGGALADAYGKARMLSAGCLLFGAASAGCAVAPTVAILISARVLQGAAAALLTPASLALIGATYPKQERNKAIGIWAAASALTTAAGPVFGGWLVENFGWQTVFWINPPLALVVVTLLCIFAPKDRREARRFDFAGAAIIACSLGALAFALSQIGRVEAPILKTSPYAEVVLAAIFSAMGIALYVWWEPRSKYPMTPPRLLANRIFICLNIATLLVYAGISIMFFLMPFDLIDRRGLSPTDAGLVFLPFTLGVGLLSRFFGSLADAIGARTMLIIGPAGAGVAYLWLALGRDLSLMTGVIFPMTLLGISFAVLVAPLTASVLSSVAEADEGLASGINNAASRVAQLAGVAIAAGLGALESGYWFGLIAAAAATFAGAITMVSRH